jgi:hypothetical protein
VRGLDRRDDDAAIQHRQPAPGAVGPVRRPAAGTAPPRPLRQAKRLTQVGGPVHIS